MQSLEMAARVTLPFQATSRNFCIKTSFQESVWDAWMESITTAVLKKKKDVTMHVQGWAVSLSPNITRYYVHVARLEPSHRVFPVCQSLAHCLLPGGEMWIIVTNNTLRTHYTHINLCCWNPNIIKLPPNNRAAEFKQKIISLLSSLTLETLN